jgi:hypothetical protein
MGAAARIRNVAGAAALVAAVALASPGVRISRAEPDASFDPALQAAAPPAPAPAEGATCAATSGPTPAVMPLRGMRLRVAPEDEALNSLNGRGYNIGRSEPAVDMQQPMYEAKRRQAR